MKRSYWEDIGTPFGALIRCGPGEHLEAFSIAHSRCRRIFQHYVTGELHQKPHNSPCFG